MTSIREKPKPSLAPEWRTTEGTAAWDIVNRLYGDVKNINQFEFSREFGKYFDPYDSTREDYALRDYQAQTGGLLSGYGQTLEQISSKQTIAGGGSVEKLQNRAYEDTLMKLNMAREEFNQSIYDFRDEYKQGMIDTVSGIADELTGHEWKTWDEDYTGRNPQGGG